MPNPPKLITFDIFGTVLDWRRGLATDCRLAGRPLRDGEFDRIVDVQGDLEQGPFLDYATITRRSLVEVLGLDDAKAVVIGRELGHLPLYPDAFILRLLMQVAPCAAMRNSDRRHREDIQAQLGSGWMPGSARRMPAPTSPIPISGGR